MEESKMFHCATWHRAQGETIQTTPPCQTLTGWLMKFLKSLDIRQISKN